MAWCPKCKSEFVEGVGRCKSCDCELVENLQEDDPINELEETEEILTEEILTDEEAEEQELAEKAYNLRNSKSTIYVKKQDKYVDTTFSAYSFLGFGVIGLIFAALNACKVLYLLNDYTMVIMTAIFIGFIFIGIVSLRSVLAIKLEIGEEESMTNQIKEWLKSNITKEDLDSLIEDDSLGKEFNYFIQMDYIKEKLNNEYQNENDIYLDQIAEEFYNEIIEE